MDRELVRREYFEWLSRLVGGERYSKQVSFNKLLRYLHKTEFRYVLKRDKKRALDGMDLRYRYALILDEYNCDRIVGYLEGPCSTLEMLVALALRCEETIMDNPVIGNRTGQWFWGMIVNLGLGSMDDNRFDEDLAYDILERFMNREYEANGKGGLFTIRHCAHDLRDIEIWIQLLWYLDSIT